MNWSAEIIATFAIAFIFLSLILLYLPFIFSYYKNQIFKSKNKTTMVSVLSSMFFLLFFILFIYCMVNVKKDDSLLIGIISLFIFFYSLMIFCIYLFNIKKINKNKIKIKDFKKINWNNKLLANKKINKPYIDKDYLKNVDKLKKTINKENEIGKITSLIIFLESNTSKINIKKNKTVFIDFLEIASKIFFSK